MRNLGWSLGASLIIIGSFIIASAPMGPYRMGIAGSGWEEGIFLIGPLIGGFVAAHALRQCSVRVLALGVLLSFVLLVGAAFLFFHALAADGEAGTSLRSLRVAALFLVGGGLGAGLGSKLRRVPAQSRSPLLWFIVAGFLSVGLICLAAALTVQVSSEPVVIGLAAIAIGPLAAGLIATVMSPVHHKLWISLATAVVPTLCLITDSADIGPAVIAFFMLWFTGLIGVAIGEKLGTKMIETPLVVPIARVED